MNLQDAKVKAAMLSSMLQDTVYVVFIEEEDEHFIGVDELFTSKRIVTWYQKGAEHGKGIQEVHSKYDAVKQHKKTVKELIEAVGEKPEKPKREPRALKSDPFVAVTFDSIEHAAKSTIPCIAMIKDKKWVVSVRGNWAIQESVMHEDSEGLVLVIRNVGYYVFNKKMWSEFGSIMASNTYKSGKPYSQSVLPKKFDKYFKKLN